MQLLHQTQTVLRVYFKAMNKLLVDKISHEIAIQNGNKQAKNHREQIQANFRTSMGLIKEAALGMFGLAGYRMCRPRGNFVD